MVANLWQMNLTPERILLGRLRLVYFGDAEQ